MRSPFRAQPSWPCQPPTERSDACGASSVLVAASLIAVMAAKAKFIIRTGAFEPWGNVILRSGVDAPVWFQKPGTKAPSYYESRVEFKDGE